MPRSLFILEWLRDYYHNFETGYSLDLINVWPDIYCEVSMKELEDEMESDFDK
jgi:hypothetical protein